MVSRRYLAGPALVASVVQFLPAGATWASAFNAPVNPDGASEAPFKAASPVSPRPKMAPRAPHASGTRVVDSSKSTAETLTVVKATSTTALSLSSSSVLHGQA